MPAGYALRPAPTNVSEEVPMRRTVLTIAMVLGCFVHPALADMIVVATSGDTKLLAGDKLDPATQLVLPEGARVTILSKTGALQVIDGPHDGPLSIANNARGETEAETHWGALKAFIGDPDARSEVLGASRTLTSDMPVPSSIWHVSVDSSGPRCARSSELTLWRRIASQAISVSVRGPASRLTDLSWAKGEHALALPDTFAVEDGNLVVSSNGTLRKLTINVLPESLADANPGLLLGWLIENKCSRQALALIDRVHEKAVIN